MWKLMVTFSTTLGFRAVGGLPESSPVEPWIWLSFVELTTLKLAPKALMIMLSYPVGFSIEKTAVTFEFADWSPCRGPTSSASLTCISARAL